MPKVSIIVPVYNVEKYIEKCLNSLVKQTMEDIEIIIVNDGSKDNSINVINKFIKQYPEQIQYLEKKNGGLSDARNYGLPYAKGEYIAFLDSDDYVEETMYEEMYNIAEKENADMVDCDFVWEYPNRKRKDIGEIYKTKKEMIEKCRVVAWNKIIKREILEKTKIKFPVGLRYEDMEFFYKLVPYINKVSFIKKCFVHYVQRENSIANTQNVRTKEIFIILDNIISYYKEKGLYDEYRDELEYIYVKFLLCSSLKRISKIAEKKERKQAQKETWDNINKKFPNWRKNSILKKKNLKNLYIKSNNKVTFKIYCFFLHLL